MRRIPFLFGALALLAAGCSSHGTSPDGDAAAWKRPTTVPSGYIAQGQRFVTGPAGAKPPAVTPSAAGQPAP